jgi:hypothetical protein
MMPFIESNNKDKLKIYYDIYCEDQDDTVVLCRSMSLTYCISSVVLPIQS